MDEPDEADETGSDGGAAHSTATGRFSLGEAYLAAHTPSDVEVASAEDAVAAVTSALFSTLPEIARFAFDLSEVADYTSTIAEIARFNLDLPETSNYTSGIAQLIGPLSDYSATQAARFAFDLSGVADYTSTIAGIARFNLALRT